MKRYREGKGPRGGVKLLSGEFVRNIDGWRKWAAVPLPSFHMEATREAPGEPLLWTLDIDGNRFSQWREDAAPGLGDWLEEILARYHGAWHLARTELGVVKKKKRGGAETARTRKNDAHDRDQALVKAAKEIIASDGPMPPNDLADRVAERTGRGREAIRKKLPRLLRG